MSEEQADCKYRCPRCQATFAWKQNLTRHWRNIHKEDLSTLPPTPACTKKGKMKAPQTPDKENSSLPQFSCPFSNCDYEARNGLINDLVLHMKATHDVHADTEHLHFDSWELFEEWKEKEEERSNAYFPQTTGVKKTRTPDGEISRYYYSCCRDGIYRHNKWTQRKTERRHLRENLKPSRKLECRCLSRLYVTVSFTGQVEVEYLPVHTNHSLTIKEEAKHLPIPQSVKESVSQKLLTGVPIPRVLQDTRQSIGSREQRPTFNSHVKRRHLITRQDCYNQQRKIREFAERRHSDDAMSVNLMVQELRQEAYNPVLTYKVQGMKSEEYPDLPESAFLLGIQTQFQRDLYQAYASTVACIDSTHSTNEYDFKLITLLVEDEFGEGQPVAWLISDREDSTVILKFLAAIKARSPNTVVTILMTDDDNTGWLAACEVYGKDIKHLLCHWHVNQRWKLALRQRVKDDVHSSEIYQTLHILLSEPDPGRFHVLLDAFEKKWNSTYPDFMEYFSKYYSSRAELWAKCYRRYQHGDTDTNMFLESFHNKLKNNPAYMDGRVNRRVDILLNILLRLEENMFFERQQKELLWKPNRKLTEEMKRHDKALSIEEDHIKETETNVWTCKSQSSESTHYTVRLLATECTSASCTVKCVAPDCRNLCRHQLECSCYDYANGHLCKHIHRVQLKRQQSTVQESSSGSGQGSSHDISDSKEAQDLQIPSHCVSLSFASDHEQEGQISGLSKVTQCRDILTELSHLLAPDEVQAVLPAIDHIHTLLSNALKSAKAVTESHDQLPQMSPKVKVAPGQRHQKQPQFHRTTKLRRRRTAFTFKQADATRKLQILRSLDADNREQALDYMMMLTRSTDDSPEMEASNEDGPAALEGAQGNPITVNDDTPDAESSTWVWGCNQADRGILLSPSEWLNDNLINAVHNLLRKQFPQYHGMQNTMCQYTSGFKPVESPFVQIVWVSGNHWICTSSIGCDDGEVDIFDSLNYPFSTSVHSIAALCRTKKRKLTLRMIDVQQQRNLHDCGLFSIAFAVSLCFGEQPHLYHYTESSMRQHLLSCLEGGKISKFPRSPRKIKQRVLRIGRLPIYCVCRQPDNGSMMVLCENCNEWFHLQCMGIQSETDLPDSDWQCTECRST